MKKKHRIKELEEEIERLTGVIENKDLIGVINTTENKKVLKN